jgi:hypothetical protein
MQSEVSAPTVYGHFNARFATIENLVDIFIPSDNFEIVAHPSHTVVLGPRGSGKTCLLKMLQPAALHKWRSAIADKIKSNIHYVGVYIPTDISWSKQAEQLGKPGLPEQYKLILQYAAFTAQVLQRIIDTVIDCLELNENATWAGIVINYRTEKELVAELAAHFRIQLTTLTLLSLKQKLAARIVDIWRFGRQETLAGPEGRNERFITNPDLNFDFFDEALYTIGLINDFTGKKDRQWAFLFDELEIAPTWLVDRLFPLLRSTTIQNVFLKLSMSPFAKLSQASSGSSPRAGHDYELIRLWYVQKTEATQFSRQLLEQTLAKRGIAEVDLHKIFGPSPLKPSTKDRTSGYGIGSKSHEVLTQAYDNDEGFREYVDSKGIDLSKLDELDENKRAAEIRKAYPIVLFRQEFRKYDQNSHAETVYRSRKKPQIFSGIDSFLEILEGNPRWIVGAANELATTILTKKKVTPSQQYIYLRETAERFMSLLKTIPLYDRENDARSLGDTLELVADRIYSSVVQARFTSEPLGSFKIDSRCPDAVLESVGVGMNAGAIILLSETEVNWLAPEELRNKEFRLSYLLSPYKHIPFRIGRPLPFSEIINSSYQKRKTKGLGAAPIDATETTELDLGL